MECLGQRVVTGSAAWWAEGTFGFGRVALQLTASCQVEGRPAPGPALPAWGLPLLSAPVPGPSPCTAGQAPHTFIHGWRLLAASGPRVAPPILPGSQFRAEVGLLLGPESEGIPGVGCCLG